MTITNMFAVPADPDPDGMTPDERRQYLDLRAQHALGHLIQRVPLDVYIAEWKVRGGIVEAMHGRYGWTDDAIRLSMRRIAKLFGFGYDEAPHLDRTGDQNKVLVSGIVFGDVQVDFWVLVKPCTCDCHGGAA